MDKTTFQVTANEPHDDMSLKFTPNVGNESPLCINVAGLNVSLQYFSAPESGSALAGHTAASKT